MIVFDLSCSEGHRFEGWFGSSDDYADQKAGSLLVCPQCGSEEIGKAPMAPSVPAKSNTRSHAPVETTQVVKGEMPAEVKKALEKLAKAQAKALESSTWVGDKFADEARSMHYGEKDEKPIHGRASAKEARDLMEEGVTVAPLLIPIAPPDELN